MVFLIALHSGLLSADTAAQQMVAEAPSPQPGDVHEYVDRLHGVPCESWTVRGLDANGYLVSVCGEYRYYRTARNLNPVKMVDTRGRVEFRFEGGFPQLDFPLSVGKQWRGEYTGHDGRSGLGWNSRVECQVTAIEDIPLPAFRIECADHWNSALVFSGVTRSTRWYSPAAGAMIRIRTEVDPDRWNIDLRSWSLGPAP